MSSVWTKRRKIKAEVKLLMNELNESTNQHMRVTAISNNDDVHTDEDSSHSSGLHDETLLDTDNPINMLSDTNDESSTYSSSTSESSDDECDTDRRSDISDINERLQVWAVEHRVVSSMFWDLFTLPCPKIPALC